MINMMKYPINHLPAGKLNLYNLQISAYLYLICLKYNLEPNFEENCIYWIDRKNEQIRKIPIELKTKEIIDMISIWIANKDNPDYFNSNLINNANLINKEKIDFPAEKGYDTVKSNESDSDFGF